MTMRSALLGLLLGMAQAVIATSAWAADPSKFELLELKLGMTVADTEATAQKAGFTVAGRDPGPSFEQAVAQRRGQRVSGGAFEGVNKIKLVRDDARVEVFFAPLPDGPRAYQIAADVLKMHGGADLKADVVAKYGEPEHRGQREWLWGDAGTFYARTKPFLEFQPAPVSATAPKPIARIILADPALQKRAQDAIASEAKKGS